MHLTEEELNEYLDKEIQDRQQVELHLSVCQECAARLSTLQALFTEIESLPELALTRNISEAHLWGTASFMGDRNLRTSLPHSLRLAVILQAALALLAIFIAAPFVIEFVSPYLTNLPMSSFTEVFIQIQSQWMAWLDMLSNFRLPTIPQIPDINLSSLPITFTLVIVSMLWLVGNGLLLRNHIK
jgi:hypothetical protein